MTGHNLRCTYCYTMFTKMLDSEYQELNEEEILDEDLIKYEVISNKGSGKIEEIFLASPKNKILRIKIDNHELLIPVNSPYIEKIDKKSETVYIKIIDGMILWK